MTATTVEQRIIQEYHCDVAELLATYAGEGLTSKQVAEKLDCGVSNVRRIARKYNIRFNQPTPQTTIVYSEEFLEKSMNPTNFLSRVWHTPSKNLSRMTETA
ncbi:MAG: hypothetical protein K0Q57_503 [Gammaproteobacteria bacterium]|jgi:hypothetical protein|nr:hypothetical protein [Gammaproteobacteria bacterium]